MMKTTCLATCVFLLSVELAAAQRTITVGMGAGYNYSTIQAAIDAATAGDTIVVYPATYTENIRFNGKSLVLRSTNPTSPSIVAATIIDGNSSGSVVTFTGTESSSCALSGFTIRNGNMPSDSMGRSTGQGGGIHGAGTHARIENNTITGNGKLGVRDGGGLFDCDGMIRNNTISDNRVYDFYGASGGGLWGCDGTIRGNVIRSNWVAATVGSYGGGLAYCQGTIEFNTILLNSASEMWAAPSSFGGGLYACNGTIQNNWISRNWAYGAGGGLSGCFGTIQNNVISGNVCLSPSFTAGGFAGGTGGGLYACRGTIQNNVIAGNLASISGGGLAGCSGMILNNTIADNTSSHEHGTNGRGGGMFQTTGTIMNCILWGNTDRLGFPQIAESSRPTDSCIDGWTSGGLGNISENPRFVSPNGLDNNPKTYEDNDYRLLPGSPCIDAGNPGPAYNDGCRPPGLGTARGDMGAYGGPRNCGVWPNLALPNLTVSGFDFSPQDVSSAGGSLISFSGVVENTGSQPTAASFWIEFRVWPGAGFQPTGPYLCDSYLITQPLGPGQRINLATLPSRKTYALPPGVYAVGILLDPIREILEQREEDNVAGLVQKKMYVGPRPTETGRWMFYR